MLALALAGPAGCGAPASPHSPAAIRARGELVVLTRNAPTTYYEVHDEPAGPEYDMARAFARSLGVKARFIVLDSTAAVLRALRAGRGDLAAAGLTRTRARRADFLFGPAYERVRQQVVCRRGARLPRSVAALSGVRLVVTARSSYVERLEALQRSHPDLHWRVDPDRSSEELLEAVSQGRVQCTVADSNIVAINRRYYPGLAIAFDLTRPQELAWALPRDARSLQRALDAWFARYRRSGALTRTMNKYYGYIRVFDYVDTRAFLRRIRTRLPKYRAMFRRAARATGIGWTWLAAQSYQESYWNARAASPTGVRGLMMLTLDTARALGVRRRLDPLQSIEGGARYLARLRAALPKSIPEPDRTWFALAAYNIGLGHIRDARTLARRLGRDPDRWSAVAKVLPLLSRERYYRTLPHGYARGSEPVEYVARIRNYRNILEHHLAATTPSPRTSAPLTAQAGGS